MPFFKLNDHFAGRYQLLELLGEGSSSEVWKAVDKLDEEAVVVLKIVVSEKEMGEEGILHLRQAFSRSRHLFHPHLLKAYHFDVWEGTPYLLMPFSSMETLADLVQEKGPLQERQIALLLSQLGAALDALHSQEPSILHQDVKPENILVSQPDFFMLADLGIGGSDSPPKTGTASTTAAYAPPESFDRTKKTAASGDIFSLGVSLYEACTATIPWNGAGGQALLKGGSAPSLPENYSAELNELLQACMSINKDKRPTAKELQRKGKHFLETGSWNLLHKNDEERKSIKKFIPYLLATVFLVLFMLSIYWGYQEEQFPLTEGKELQTDRLAEQEIDQMLISTLEDELAVMKQRTLELEEENKQLKGGRQENSILRNNQAPLVEKEQGPSGNMPQPDPKEENQLQAPMLSERKALEESPADKEASSSLASSTAKESLRLSGAVEKQLNKIADPQLSGKARSSWKEETMAQFAEGAIRIIDETEGKPKRYSAGIFLNLLYKVPHTIVVKEVKTDQNSKITELRLTMEAKM